jgi:hypothetical protein
VHAKPLAMTPCESEDFLQLRAEIEAHEISPGYYIIKLAEIGAERNMGRTEEEIAEQVFQWFDDQEWPPAENRPTDQTWGDYAVERAPARDHILEALVGGPPFGHTEETMSMTQAASYFDRFDSLFEDPKTYYINLGFGDPEHVFLHGVAVISATRAGYLGVVQSD